MKKRSEWWLGACVAIGVSSWGTAGASAPAPSAPRLMALAIHNAESAGWVHEVTHATDSGHIFSMVNDIGATEGRQVILSDGAHARVLVVNGDAFLYGDDKAIANYFGLSTTDPQKYSNQWLEIRAVEFGLLDSKRCGDVGLGLFTCFPARIAHGGSHCDDQWP